MAQFKDVAAAAAFSSDKMKKVNLFDTPRMFCDVYCFEPQQQQSAHAHADADKVYYVISGRGRFTVGDEERDAGAGTAIHAPAGATHAVHNPGPERLQLLVFMAPKP